MGRVIEIEACEWDLLEWILFWREWEEVASKSTHTSKLLEEVKKKEPQYNRLEDHVRHSLDMAATYRIVEERAYSPLLSSL